VHLILSPPYVQHRSYISFDILRRILSDYFGYNIHYVMNITDIDDKIIRRARQNHLFDEYAAEAQKLPLDELLGQQKEVLQRFQDTCAKNTDPDKKIMLDKTLQRMNDAVEALTKAVGKGDEREISEKRLLYLNEAKDPISDWLDSLKGAQINDNAVFEALPRYWEDQFHNDMKSLNVSYRSTKKVESFANFMFTDSPARCFNSRFGVRATNRHLYSKDYRQWLGLCSQQLRLFRCKWLRQEGKASLC